METFERIAAILLLGALAGVQAGATDFTFQPTDGKWNIASNWYPNDIPTINDKATIPSGKKCRIEDQDEAIRTLDVSGTLELNNHKLTISPSGTSSTIGGTVDCLSSAQLRVLADLTLNGAGTIRALGNASLTIEAYDTGSESYKTVHVAGTSLTVKGSVTFLCNIDNDGTLLVDDDDTMQIGSTDSGKPRVTVAGDGLFKVADIDGVLKFCRSQATASLSGSACLEVDAGTLWLTEHTAEWACDTGDERVLVTGGALDLDVNFTTSGDLDFQGGKITLAAGKAAWFAT